MGAGGGRQRCASSIAARTSRMVSRASSISIGWVERSDKAEGRRTAAGWSRVAGFGKAEQTHQYLSPKSPFS